MSKIIKKISFLIFIAVGSKLFAMEQQANILEQIAKVSKDVLGSTDFGPAVPYVGVTIQAISTGIDMKSYCLPGKEERAKAARDHESLTFLKLEDNFIECLITHQASSKIANSGGPAECEDLVKAFIQINKMQEMKSMIATFKQNRK